MAKKPLPKLLIIDGNALIHRSFHALPPTLTTKKGEMVNAVYGFTMVLIKALKEIKPEYVILTLDKKGPTFRHQVFKEYKAQRIKAPKELYQQISKVKAIANAFSIPIYSQKGYEADDLIGSICFQVGDKAEKIILTGDLDVLQLVNDNTKVYTMHRGLSDHIIYDEAMVRQRFGLKPCQLVDFKALRGDPSDNIPGVRGVGEKTAITLLQHFGTLENVYSFLDKKSNKEPKFLTARLRRLLLEHKQEAFLSKKLATIKTNLPLEINLKKARFGKFNQDAIVCLFQELEFKSLLPRLHDLSPLPKVPDSKFIRNQTQFNYHLIEEEKDFQAFLKRLKRATEFV
ncbi:DNA polymerase I, partial [Candidatus Parcubacteria bacterium]